jgi:hypothetical protein
VTSASKQVGVITGRLFWIVCLVAVISLLSNAYLLYFGSSNQLVKKVPVLNAGSTDKELSESTTKINTFGDSGIQAQLRSLVDGVSRNSEQLELLIGELDPKESPEMLAKRAEWEETHKLARDARRQRDRDRMLLHLEPNDRAAALHQRWLSENESFLRLTEAELAEVERSGIEAQKRYDARHGNIKD